MGSPTGMKQRCWAHDYCAPSFYMVTIVTEPRRNCLSEVVVQGAEMHEQGAGMQDQGAAPATGPATGPAAPACLKLFPMGETVLEVWRRTTRIYPGVEACECVAMPDHFHGILWVKERLPRHVGHIIKAFKRVSEKECRSRGLLPPTALGSVTGAAQAPTSLWEEGYHDSILLRRGQLKAMVNYIADNPRRLALKRANPDLFTVARDLTVAQGRVCPAFGNLFLLDYPIKRQVRVSRSILPESLTNETEELLYAAKHGTVLVSPCISPGEKEIARAALEAGLPLIVILANGFSPMYKPSGQYFDACANGRLLMLAPFPYHREKTTITREQCLILNGWAKDVMNSREIVT